MRLTQTLTTLPRETRDTLFLLLVIAWLMAPHAAHLPLWASAFAAGLLLWRAALAWRNQPLPRAWVAMVLLAVAAVAAWTPLHEADWWQQSQVAPWMVQMLQGLRPALPEEFGRHLPS